MPEGRAGTDPVKVKTYRAAHILLKAKYEAEDLLIKLRGGSDFEALARRFSTCTSAAKGGDLGEFKIDQAEMEFEEAALELKVGEISKAPVRTRFGYHLIKRIG